MPKKTRIQWSQLKINDSKTSHRACSGCCGHHNNVPCTALSFTSEPPGARSGSCASPTTWHRTPSIDRPLPRRRRFLPSRRLGSPAVASESSPPSSVLLSYILLSLLALKSVHSPCSPSFPCSSSPPPSCCSFEEEEGSTSSSTCPMSASSS